jgi:hypothetical protein
MRDIIWTLIIVWLIYKVIDLFKINAGKKNFADHQDEQFQRQNSAGNTNSSPEKDLKNAVKKHLNNEGEYIDFEEVK